MLDVADRLGLKKTASKNVILLVENLFTSEHLLVQKKLSFTPECVMDLNLSIIYNALKSIGRLQLEL